MSIPRDGTAVHRSSGRSAVRPVGAVLSSLLMGLAMVGCSADATPTASAGLSTVARTSATGGVGGVVTPSASSEPSVSATASPSASPARPQPTASAGATRSTATTPRPTATATTTMSTLGALNAAMNAAVLARGSVAFVERTSVGDQVSNTYSGKVLWRKGVTSYDVTGTGDYVTQRIIAVPGARYTHDLRAEDDPTLWIELPEADSGRGNQVAALQWLERQMTPGRLHANLARLTVTRGTATTVDGVPCIAHTVRMTTAQYYSSQPATLRPAADQMNGKTVVTYYLDKNHLPRKVVELVTWTAAGKRHSYREVSTFTRWGSPVTIALPSGAHIVPF